MKIFILVAVGTMSIVHGASAFGQVIKFEKTYGGPSVDEAYAVQRTGDGGYILAGNTSSVGPGNRVYLVRTDSLGDTLWTRAFGGVINDYGFSVAQTADGGFITAGVTFNFGSGGGDALLIRTNSQGSLLWMKAYGGTDYDEAVSVAQTSDGGFVFAGSTLSYGGGAFFYIVRTNAGGDTLWTRSFGETGEDYGSCIQPCSDGGFIVVGTREMSFNGGNACLMRVGDNGTLMWSHTYSGSQNSIGKFVQQTADSGYIMTGSMNSAGGGRKISLTRTTSTGDTVWTRAFGGSDIDIGLCVRQIVEGGFIIAGNTAGPGARGLDVILIKTNANGDTLWERLFGGAGFDEGRSAEQLPDGSFIIAGRTTSFGAGSFDAYLIKTDQEGLVTSVRDQTVQLPAEFSLQQNYPNPFNPSTDIVFSLSVESFVRLTVFDALGRAVERLVDGRLGRGDHTAHWNAEAVAAGVYYYELKAGSNIQSKKMVLIK